MVVKPEDIPGEIVDIENERCAFAYWQKLTPKDIAAIANDLIEAGVVSPPCHVIKHDDGYVIDHGYHRNVRVWPGHGTGPNCEHYKGQTQ